MKVFSALALLAAAIQCVVASDSERKLLRAGAYDFSEITGGMGDSTPTQQQSTTAGVPGLDGLNGISSITKTLTGGGDGASKLLPTGGLPSPDSLTTITNGVGGISSITDKLPIGGGKGGLPSLPSGSSLGSITNNLPIGGGKLPGVGSLSIGKLPSLDSLPIGSGKLPGVESLPIGASNLPGLDSLPIGGGKLPGVDNLPTGESKQGKEGVSGATDASASAAKQAY